MAVWLLAVGGQGGAGIDDPRLDNTASHPSSMSHMQPASPCRLSSRGPLRRRLWPFMGGLVLRLECACMLRLLILLCTVVICWSAVSFGFGYGYGRIAFWFGAVCQRLIFTEINE